MNYRKQEMIRDGLIGAARTATLTASGAIVSGAALTTVTVPQTILWGLITVGSTTTTVVAAPVVAAFAAGGAVVGGLAAIYRCYRNHRTSETMLAQFLITNAELPDGDSEMGELREGG